MSSHAAPGAWSRRTFLQAAAAALAAAAGESLSLAQPRGAAPAGELTRTPGLYQAPVRRHIENGAKVTASEYIAGRQAVLRVRREVRDVFRDVDALVMPTLRIPARTISEAIARAQAEKPRPPEPSTTMQFNFYGLPTISIPCGFTKLGLPIGLQIAGPHLQEGRVLALARAYEQATPWHTRRPEPPR